MFLSTKGQVSSPVLFKQQPFDVLSYDVALEFPSPPKAIVSNAVCTISFTWLEDPKGLSFPFHLRDLIVDSVFYNNIMSVAEEQSTSATDTFHYAVPAPLNAKKGDTVSVKVFYHGNMGNEPAKPMSWGGVYGTKRILYALGVGFYANYVSTTQHWLACYDHPSDKALFKGTFTVPKGVFVCSNGTLKKIDTLPTSLRYTWQTEIPTATYLLTFAVDTFKTYTFGNPNNVVYAIAQDSIATSISFKLLPKMIATLEQYYGAYPFEKVGYVLTPTGSMEHQTMISIDEAVVRKKDTMNSVALHELAHQWFGDLVSPQDFRYAWLTESFATFSESLWAGANKPSGYITDQQSKLTQYFNSVVGSEGVLCLENFSRTVPSSNYPRTIYIKGAIVLGMLRHQLGDSIFFASLKKYLNDHKYGVATTEDFINSVESLSGKNMQWFFDQWVKRKGWPRLQIDTNGSLNSLGKKLSLHIKQVQPKDYGTFIDIPLEIGFRLPDNSMFYRTISIANTDTIIHIDSLPDYKSITLNQGPSLRSLLQIASVTGIESSPTFSSDSLHIYPNPGQDIITIEHPFVKNEVLRISIYDIKGNVVKTWKEQNQTTSSMTALLDIDSSELISGTYTIIVQTDKKSISQQCIIKK